MSDTPPDPDRPVPPPPPPSGPTGSPPAHSGAAPGPPPPPPPGTARPPLLPPTSTYPTIRGPVPPPPGFGTGGPPPGGPAPNGAQGDRRRRGALIAVGIVVTVAVLGAGAFLLARGDDDEVTVAEPTVPDAGTIPADATAPSATSPDPTSGSATAPGTTEFTLPAITVPDDTGRGGTVPTGAPGAIPEPTQEPVGLGDDPTFDALARECYGGDMQACDDLYDQSPARSEYETYGDTCAGRQPAGTRVYCRAAFPGPLPEPTEDPTGLGDDPAFDALAQACFAGDMGACDDLYLQSPVGSKYESYGATCAGRLPEADGNDCESLLGAGSD